MTIDEAIKTIALWWEGGDMPSIDNIDKAVKLGIEALKYVQMVESWKHTRSKLQLFGETEK